MEKSAFCMQPALRLLRLGSLLEKHADQVLQQDTGLTFSQCRILLSLRENPSCSQRCLARCLDLTQAAVSRQTEMLREKGLLTREENAENRREHVLKLTAKGKKQLEEGMELVTEKFEAAFSVLSMEDITSIRTGVDKLLEHLRGLRDGDCD
jgi:DNA-binding MarR family transcriptional regulator